MVLRSIIHISLLLLSLRVEATPANFDNYAEEFYLGFPPNLQLPQLITKKLYLTTRESTNVSVCITIGSGVSETVTVQPGKVTEYKHSSLVTVVSGTDLNKGIHVRAEEGKKIAVSASSYHPGAAGSFTVLPCHTYPSISEYVYYAISSETELAEMHSTLLLVGSSDGTRVTLTPSQNITIPAQLTDTGVDVDVMRGSSHAFTLNRLQTFLIMHLRDITGTKVVSDKPMAVISSHQCANVPTAVGYCDFIVEQIPPTVTWGKTHFARSFTSRSSNAHYKVIASDNETALNITCRNNMDYEFVAVKLSSGELYSHMTSANTTCSFTSSKPVMVVQLSEGGESEGYGDPLAMLVTPAEQYVSELSTIVPVFNFTTDKHNQGFLEIYSIDSDDSLLVNNQPLSSMEAIYSNTDIVGYVSTVPIPDTSHVTVTSNGNVPFLVRYYGFSSAFDALGHLIAMQLDPIAVPWVSVVNNTSVIITESTNSAAVPILVSGATLSPATVTLIQCNGSPLPSQFQVEPITVVADREVDSVYEEITIYTADDDILEKPECFCLKLSPVQNSNVYFNGIYEVPLCFEDNEALIIELVKAVLKESQVQMTFSVLGFTGSVLVPLVFLPVIQYPDLGTSDQELSNFTIYYTPQLTEITYSIAVNSEILWSESPRLVVTLLTMDYNISFDQNSLVLENFAAVGQNYSGTDTLNTDSPSTITTTTSPPTTTTSPTTTNPPTTNPTTITSTVIDFSNSQLMLVIWVLVGILFVTILYAVIISFVCCCIYLQLRHLKTYQVDHEKPGPLPQLWNGRSLSDMNLHTRHSEGASTIPTQHGNCLSVSSANISISNGFGGISRTTSQDTCNGSRDPLVSKPNSPSNSPIHVSTVL